MRIIILAVLLSLGVCVQAADGLVTVASQHDVQTTTDKLESAVKAKGMKVFLRVDHAAGAASVGGLLRPTQLLIFGNPRLGSALMGCAQTSGIDLPMKALVYQDGQGKVYLSYNDPAYLKSRHEMAGCDKPISNATGALANIARLATQ